MCNERVLHVYGCTLFWPRDKIWSVKRLNLGVYRKRRWTWVCLVHQRPGLHKKLSSHDGRKFGTWGRTVNWRLPSTYRLTDENNFFLEFMVGDHFFSKNFFSKKVIFYSPNDVFYTSNGDFPLVCTIFIVYTLFVRVPVTVNCRQLTVGLTKQLSQERTY